MLAVGKVIKAHGIRGDLKVESFMDSPDCFNKIKKIIINEKHCQVEKISRLGNFLLLKISDCNDMNTAELYKNKLIYVEEEDLPTPNKGRFYISEIIGCIVSDGERDFGKIKDILQYGSADVVVAEKKGRTIMFPWINSLQAKVDIDSKLFIVNKDKLKEVILDDN